MKNIDIPAKDPSHISILASLSVCSRDAPLFQEMYMNTASGTIRKATSALSALGYFSFLNLIHLMLNLVTRDTMNNAACA